MVTDNLQDALAELRRMADPDVLAAETLEGAADAMVEYDSERIEGLLHRGRWQNRSGDLEEGYGRTEVEKQGAVYSIEEINEAEHAPYVEALDGISVLTAFDDGSADRILRESFETARRHQEQRAR